MLEGSASCQWGQASNLGLLEVEVLEGSASRQGAHESNVEASKIEELESRAGCQRCQDGLRSTAPPADHSRQGAREAFQVR